MRVVVFSLCWFLTGSIIQAEEFQFGVLKQILGTAQGEPGQVVQYRPSPNNEHEIEVIFEQDTLRHEYNYIVVPLDSTFTVSWAYLQLKSQKPLFSQKKDLEDRHRFLLAKNVSEQFPNHFLHEEMLAQLCSYAEKHERHVSYGKTRFPITLGYIRAYLSQYPDGKYKDEIDWKRVQLENHVYEFEGQAGGIIQQAKRFETYLQNHPNTSAKPEMTLRIARLYRMAYECTLEDPGDNAAFIKNKDLYFQKAVMYYEGLLQNEDVQTRETARTALYSMKAGRRIYMNSNDW